MISEHVELITALENVRLSLDKIAFELKKLNEFVLTKK